MPPWPLLHPRNSGREWVSGSSGGEGAAAVGAVSGAAPSWQPSTERALAATYGPLPQATADAPSMRVEPSEGCQT